MNLIGYVQNLKDTRQGTYWILEDITEQKAIEERLHHTLRENETIIQSAPVAFAFSRDRKIVRFNKRFRDMFRLDEKMMSQPGRSLYRSDDEYNAVGAVAGPLLSQEKPLQTELWMRRGDGTDFWANLYGYVLNPDDPAEGTVWLCEDRSVAKREEDEELGRASVMDRK